MKKLTDLLPEDRIAEYVAKYVVPQRSKVRKMILKTRKNKDGLTKIMIEVSRYRYLTQDGKKYENVIKRISTDVWVKPSNWSIKRQEVLKSDIEFSEKNRLINEKYSDILNYINTKSLDNTFDMLNKTDLLKIEQLFPSKKMLLGKYLTDYIEKYIENRKSYSARGTWKEYITLKNRLMNYEKHRGKKLVFVDINFTFSDDFYLWAKQQEYSEGTIYKTYELLITFMYYHWKVRDEQRLEMNDKFQQKGFIKGRKESNEPNPLSENEYQLLWQKNFDTPGLNRTRDRFLLQCCLGCRYSDIFTFKPQNFKNGMLNYSPIKTVRKRNNTINLPLQDDAVQLLKKYNYDTTKLYLSNQKYNEALEIMFNKLEIPVRTSHHARDTFITRAIDAGVSIPVLLKWTGQESYAVMEKYYKYTETHSKKESEKLNRRKNL